MGGLTILFLLKLGDVDISYNTLRRLKPGYLALAILIHYSGFAVRGLRWQALLAALGYRLSFLYVTALLLAGWFISALVPARLGDVARAAILKRDHDAGLAQGFASIATERALDISAILLLTVIAAVWALPGRVPPQVWQVIGGGIIIMGIALAILIAIPKLQTPLSNLFPHPLYRKSIGFGFELLASIRRVGQSPGLLLLVFAQSLYIWLCDVFLMYFIFLSLGQAVPLSITAFTSMVVDLAAAVPIMPGAVLQFEGTALGVLNLFRIEAGQSSLMIILNRFISFWTFIVFSGVVTYLFGFAQAVNPDALKQQQTLPQNN